MAVARIAMKLQNVKCHSEPRGQMLVEAARVLSAQPGEVYVERSTGSVSVNDSNKQFPICRVKTVKKKGKK